MIVPPRISSLNSPGPQVLEILDIREEEIDPEKRTYEEEERKDGRRARSHRKGRMETIVFTKGKK